VFHNVWLKNLSPPRFSFKIKLKFSKVHLVTCQRFVGSFFSKISIHTKKMIFRKKNEKFRKKSALIFSQVGSKVSQLNNDQKVGLRQAHILKF
jgi:hypothetical protein